MSSTSAAQPTSDADPRDGSAQVKDNSNTSSAIVTPSTGAKPLSIAEQTMYQGPSNQCPFSPERLAKMTSKYQAMTVVMQDKYGDQVWDGDVKSLKFEDDEANKP